MTANIASETPGPERSGRIGTERWRKQSAAMGRHVTAAILDAAEVNPGMRVLDVGCGTGEPAISLAAMLRDSGEVVGIDISPELLQISERRARERQLTNLRFQREDAHRLPFADNSFDRITSRFGVMFFLDLPQALAEMHRVLKPGGKAAFLAWGSAQQPYFDATVGTLLRLMPGSALPPGGSRMFVFAQPGPLSAALRGAGFSRVKEEFLETPWIWPGTPEEMWRYFQDVTLPLGALFQQIPEERSKEIDGEVLQTIGRHYDGNQVNFAAQINLTSGWK